MLALRQTAETVALVQFGGWSVGLGLFGLLYLGLFDHLWVGGAKHAAGHGRPSTSERLWLTLAAQAESYTPPGRPFRFTPSRAYEALKSARLRAAERSMARRTAALAARPAGVVHPWPSAWGEDEWL
jgi:hypothetical protein